MKKVLIAGAMAFTLLATGCATQTVALKGSSAAQPTYTTNQKFFIGGIGQEQSLDVAKICNGAENVAQVQSHQSGKNILLGVLTLGIYTPRTANVYCK